MSKDNDKIDLFAELDEIHQNNEKNKKNKVQSVQVTFEDDIIEDDSDVERTVKINTDTKKKYASSVPARSQEEYEEWIESTHFTVLTKEDGTTYEVKVTVLKPGINPLENLRPAYAYSTSC